MLKKCLSLMLVFILTASICNVVPFSALVLVDGYYLAGNFNSWGESLSTEYKFELSNNASVEYTLKNVYFSLNDKFKVVLVNGGTVSDWFPMGQNNDYIISEDGFYDIVFRPDGLGSTDWWDGNYGNYFYVDGPKDISSESLKNGDTFYLGEYPQSEVTDSALTDKLNKQSGSWISYNYNDSDGHPSDFMRYKDIDYCGKKYRCVTFDDYRPEACQSDNGYNTNEVYWFEYQPIKWTLINTNTGFSICDLAIDSQMYNHTSETTNGYYGNNYEKSDIRNWLLNIFYTQAFSKQEETECLSKRVIDNSAENSLYSSIPTEDYVFLLSKPEADYLSSAQRKCKSTDYAKCQGVGYVNEDNCVKVWCTRTAASEYYSIYYVENKWGEYIAYYNWYDDAIQINSFGIRPAIYIDVEKAARIQNNYIIPQESNNNRYYFNGHSYMLSKEKKHGTTQKPFAKV